MLRFTIRDMLWLTVVVALLVLIWMDQQRFEVLRAQMQAQQAEIANLRHAQAVQRLAALREKELRREVILTPGPRGPSRAPRTTPD
jgi:hypothetical protein